MDRNVYREEFTVGAEGLHARPSMALVDVASMYDGSVSIKYGDNVADGKSIMQVFGLGVTKGNKVLLEIVGEGAEEIAERIIKAVNSK